MRLLRPFDQPQFVQRFRLLLGLLIMLTLLIPLWGYASTRHVDLAPLLVQPGDLPEGVLAGPVDEQSAPSYPRSDRVQPKQYINQKLTGQVYPFRPDGQVVRVWRFRTPAEAMSAYEDSVASGFRSVTDTLHTTIGEHRAYYMLDGTILDYEYLALGRSLLF